MSETQTDMSTSGDQQRQQVAEDDIDNLSLQRIYTRDFDDGAVRVSFQIIRLEKQVFVYVGLVHGDTLDSMSISVPMAQV